jgi:4-aminobutyrate aminotransferase-like enzyme
MPDLREAIHELKGGKPAILEIERRGQFLYVEWDVEKQPLQPTDRTGKRVSDAEQGPRGQ